MSKPTIGEELDAVYVELGAVSDHLRTLVDRVEGPEALFFRAEVREIARGVDRARDRISSARDWPDRKTVSWKYNERE